MSHNAAVLHRAHASVLRVITVRRQTADGPAVKRSLALYGSDPLPSLTAADHTALLHVTGRGVPQIRPEKNIARTRA
mgnify:CR=1 FL=1